MRAVFFLSYATAISLFAAVNLQTITVEDEAMFDKAVDKEEIKFTRQQDLAQVLQELHPQITMVRASAVGNDIILRGFKRDDLNLLIDGAKVYGGCPNRMDPPAMHISVSDIQKVQIIEGPVDVENFGSMGGAVKVFTQEPPRGFGGSIETLLGSFGYKKFDASLFGGDGKFDVSIGGSYENSDQYKDGSKKSLVEQNWLKVGKESPDAYQERYKDRSAYTKDALRAKLNYHITSNQKLKLSLLSEKATNVLYPAFQMDALLDKTLILNSSYTIKNLGKYSKELSLSAYYSGVTHDMGTKFRNAALDPKKYRTHHVKSRIKGAKIIDSFQVANTLYKIGIDGSLRNWNGICLAEPTKRPKQVRIPDVDTKNRAIFVEALQKRKRWEFMMGFRYDATTIKAKALHHQTIAHVKPIQNYFRGKSVKDYHDISGFFKARYSLNHQNSLSFSIGEGIRVPDAQELYFIGFMNGNWNRRGNPNLKESKNKEIDLAYEGEFEAFSVKCRLFFSKLKDYIYAYATSEGNKNLSKKYLTWANINAHLYGGDVSVALPFGEFWLLEGALAYQRGRKDSLLPHQKDRDLAQIPPLRGRLALSFDNGDWFAMAEILGSAKYSHFDSDNNERAIGSWSVCNLKASKRYNSVTLNMGIDNLFDTTYALNNTYVGRALIGGKAPLLINEPGRFIYANINYTF